MVFGRAYGKVIAFSETQQALWGHNLRGIAEPTVNQ